MDPNESSALTYDATKWGLNTQDSSGLAVKVDNDTITIDPNNNLYVGALSPTVYHPTVQYPHIYTNSCFCCQQEQQLREKIRKIVDIVEEYETENNELLVRILKELL